MPLQPKTISMYACVVVMVYRKMNAASETICSRLLHCGKCQKGTKFVFFFLFSATTTIRYYDSNNEKFNHDAAVDIAATCNTACGNMGIITSLGKLS